MLDLRPIKGRLAAATPGPWSLDVTYFQPKSIWARVGKLFSADDATFADCDLIAHAPTDLASLVAEAERLRIAVDMYRRITGDNEAEIKRLRGAIQTHREQCHKTYKVAQAWWDEELWAVLDA